MTQLSYAVRVALYVASLQRVCGSPENVGRASYWQLKQSVRRPADAYKPVLATVAGTLSGFILHFYLFSQIEPRREHQSLLFCRTIRCHQRAVKINVAVINARFAIISYTVKSILCSWA